MTAQGSPHAVFRRAIEAENYVAAELNARMLGRPLTLVEALDLTAVVALKNPNQRGRYTARWLTRWLAETPGATLEDAAIVVAYLGALGGPRHAQVVASLRGIVQRS
jgi:hypothetical protein